MTVHSLPPTYLRLPLGFIRMSRINAIRDMILNEDFNTMSQIAIVNNDDVEYVVEDEIGDEIESDRDETESDTDDELEEDEVRDETSYGKVQKDYGFDILWFDIRKLLVIIVLLDIVFMVWILFKNFKDEKQNL
ncbi:hypothetical protein QVD17_37286 [Tagetes erecta]|uniref:Uncharacterized protein n=1 Tax=Tagetes erecta TaxID=13708 RepID=A0AAD8NJ20_TARER|nr:hypothetical protein QVD17_37286 [Tagetes erecta]